MAILERFITPTVQIDVAPTHIRRCTFRRITLVESKGALPVYDVACLFPDRETPLPLGDIETARPACESCTALGLFRPDSD
jgi:hypothetical protein